MLLLKMTNTLSCSCSSKGTFSTQKDFSRKCICMLHKLKTTLYIYVPVFVFKDKYFKTDCYI